MLHKLEEPIWFEKTVYLLKHDFGTSEERHSLAQKALEYLYSVGGIKVPDWDFLHDIIRPNITNSNLEETSTEFTDIFIQKVLLREYSEALVILESLEIKIIQYYQYLEEIGKLLVLKRDFHGLEKLSYRLEGYHQNNKETESISIDELHSYQRCKLMLTISKILEGNFFETCYNVFQLWKENPEIILNHVGKHHASSNIQENIESIYSKEEIEKVILVSVIISIPLDEMDKFSHLIDLQDFFQEMPIVEECLKMLKNTQFKNFFLRWYDEIKPIFEKSMLLGSLWSKVDFIMCSKIYYFYLKISSCVRISYLSNILGIRDDVVRSQLLKLIDIGGLNFKVDEQNDDIVLFKERDVLDEAIEMLKINERLITQKLQQRNNLFENIVFQSSPNLNGNVHSR
ncbi:hypothetical protein TBLA_0C04820 [Henningerozyma blattae CBS 6284]|uniref:PCI domain-containing protein n=1 Tax=Henningerozyma blattae (strain ATCC 34711 / CBS 6284 / DSM 70876 / NBRC 10599 / NRRL Y-10934 / UCD 77-7) TaxID=1071380 RepID=I2H1M6_HENB6|nr:hypothetical protein TBLA_0C04820 [Tetrapisispora blattae CBS 6284]CCH60278.1 hypothetical protein TBLA_0C04820 [Tetrapisispora blattae CBS 6284]